MRGARRAGLAGYRIGLGDASLYPALLDAHGVPAAARSASCTSSGRATSSGSSARWRGCGWAADATEALQRVPQRRGGAEVLEAAGPAADGLRAVVAPLPTASRSGSSSTSDSPAGSRYYTGAVFEVYDAALGAPLGGGGRYDDLLGRFGRDLPAAGWALNVERLHIALVGERRGEGL